MGSPDYPGGRDFGAGSSGLAFARAQELFEDPSLDLEVFVKMQQRLEMLAVLEAVMGSGCLVLKHASVSGEEALEDVVVVVVCVDNEAVMRV